jgi:hypothetical protein
VKAELRTIGMVSGRYKPECRFRSSPVTPLQSGSVGVVGGALGGALGGAIAGLLVPLAEPRAILVYPALPILVGVCAAGGAAAGAVVGGTTGAFMGVPKSKAEKAEAAIRNAIDELNVQETMREKVLTVAQEQTPYQFVVIEDQGTTAISDKPIYTSSGDRRIDAILETNVWSYGLWSEEVINPPLQLFINVSVRLIRVRDGTVLYSKNLRRESMGRKLVDWGANSAEEFKDGVHFCSYSLAKQIVRDLFN